MKNFDSRPYSIADFIEWNDNGLLELSPDFQRRSVWSLKVKSYLIDTIIRGKPIPKILITQRLEAKRQFRTVVDGQQRLRAILGFYNGDFKISRAHNPSLAGSKFDDLAPEIQNDYLEYELGVDLLFNMEYPDILDIFARINSYTVSLNKQEKINAKYLGYFKQYAFEYGLKYVEYFLRANILTKSQITRMGEAQLASDLLVALAGGVQTTKNTEQFYKRYEDEPGTLKACAERFDKIMTYLGAIYKPDEMGQTNWSRIHLFYTLFTVIGHCLYGLQGLKPKVRVRLNEGLVGAFRAALDDISERYNVISKDLENPNHPADFKKFITQSRRATTDTRERVERAEFVCEQLLQRVG